MGTHFDVMNKEFPFDYLHLPAIIFDVSNIKGRDISIQDIEINLINKDMFVIFYTSFLKTVGYGTKDHFQNHTQLSNELIETLIKKEINIIGIDCAGIRCGKKHTPIDQYCADHNVFVVENLCNLDILLNHNKSITCYVNTYPINYTNMTGLPCRVVAEK